LPARSSAILLTFMKYFIYCRKSSEAEDRQVLSIDSQEAEIRRAFAERPDIEIVAIFREAYSACKRR